MSFWTLRVGVCGMTWGGRWAAPPDLPQAGRGSAAAASFRAASQNLGRRSRGVDSISRTCHTTSAGLLFGWWGIDPGLLGDHGWRL
jgi:hypothetical protein